jgi:uncharacterized damage-inducible protein DinB
MTIDDVRRVLVRELGTIAAELEAYPDDASVWACPPGLPNAAGTLALHLVGNLRYFVGARLGGTGYVRDRAAEFATRGVSRADLRAQVDAAVQEVGDALARLTPAHLDERFPEPIGGVHLSTGRFLQHLVAHTGYHLGQLDYHRRVVTGDARGVGALPIARLAD